MPFFFPYSPKYEESFRKKLLKIRSIEEIEQGLGTVEIGKLTLHNFTLQMPLQDITINKVLAVNSLYLSECSSFAINSLFAFFLKQGK